jgi:hypothetical protein
MGFRLLDAPAARGTVIISYVTCSDLEASPSLGTSCVDLVTAINNDIGDSSEWRGVVMPKVFALHEMELQPGVQPEEYERFFAEEIAPMPELPGWRTRLLKGERGARTGKYLVLFEIESLEARDRYFPRPGEESKEFTRFFEQHPEAAAAMEKWEKYSPFDSENDITTDYVVVAE